MTVKYYIIDVEILFSRAPFLNESTEEFSYVKPIHREEREIKYDAPNRLSYLNIELPEKLKNLNMVVEINGEGKQLFKTYYSSSLKLTLMEAYGELKVTDMQGKPLSQVYIKVFGDARGSIKFFKDGYTDIRGKFEYGSMNAGAQFSRFGILVMSDDHGSLIKEVKPPKTESQTEDFGAGLNNQRAERIMKKHKKF